MRGGSGDAGSDDLAALLQPCARWEEPLGHDEVPLPAALLWSSSLQRGALGAAAQGGARHAPLLSAPPSTTSVGRDGSGAGAVPALVAPVVRFTSGE